jgi:drug/metabolite transporter (DMT)-like permease
VFVRTGLGAALLLPFALGRGRLRALRGRWRAVLAFAGLELVGPWLLLSDAERTLSSSMTGLLVATVPILGVLAPRLFGDRRRIGAARLAGLLVGFGGVALLAGPALESGGAWPIAEVLLAAVGYAVAPVIADRSLRGVPTLTLSAVCLAFAALVSLPAAVLSWPQTMPSGAALASLGALATVCTALAFVLFFKLIAEVGPARATVIAYVNPAVAVALGAVVLDEPLTLVIGVSFVLILTGSFFGTGRRTTDPPAGDLSVPGDLREARHRAGRGGAGVRRVRHGAVGRDEETGVSAQR